MYAGYDYQMSNYLINDPSDQAGDLILNFI